MQLYSENKDYKLYQGSMLDMLEVIEPNTIDSVICDPPYELNFMNKGWDNSGIAFQPDTWKKCYEVLKPGGYLLAFGGSRTFHRIACAIEDAGFEIRDTIMWLYGSGFPKSMDISKQIDKKGGTDLNWFADFLNKTLKEKNMTTIELAEKGKFYGNVNHGGLVSNWIKGKTTPTPAQFNKMCKILELPFKDIEEVERKVIGQYKGAVIDETTIGFGKRQSKERTIVDITVPSTDLAKQWQGWGTALKPSFEPIIVARKPFKGSLVDNVIEYGVGGINIDECRVETNNKLIETISGGSVGLGEKIKGHKYIPNELGRFPANTIMTYDVNNYKEVCAGFKTKEDEYNARYFYCAKASKKDRDEGLEEFNDVDGGSYQFRQDGSLDGKIPVRKNTHPTVKPTELMQYLVRLVTPNGGTVLDPFNGSGSTGKAVMYENKERNKNYKYIGIELTEEYLPIAKVRIEYVCNLKPEVNPQMSIFDLENENEKENL